MKMNNVHDFSKNPGALAQVMRVAQASMDLWEAQHTADYARSDYIESIHCYEEQHGPLGGRLNAESKAHAAIRKFTAETYEAYRHAKRQVYNAKRRLDTACRKLAFPR
jgi:hypothetical protein